METKEGYHVGLIMDGNGRFATQKGEPRLFGHAAGVTAVKQVAKGAHEAGVHTITLFAFAIANWKREQAEVDGLWELFLFFLASELDELLADGMRLRVIGKRDGLPEKVLAAAVDAEERSKDNTGLLMQIALNYDGVDEVVRMMQQAIAKGVTAKEVDSTYVRNHLDTEAGNEPDVVIRTGMKERDGQFSYWRSSAFLPLQSAQAVCVGTTTLWPDFSIQELKEIITFADPESRLFGSQRPIEQVTVKPA